MSPKKTWRCALAFSRGSAQATRKLCIRSIFPYLWALAQWHAVLYPWVMHHLLFWSGMGYRWLYVIMNSSNYGHEHYAIAHQPSLIIFGILFKFLFLLTLLVFLIAVEIYFRRKYVFMRINPRCSMGSEIQRYLKDESPDARQLSKISNLYTAVPSSSFVRNVS